MLVRSTVVRRLVHDCGLACGFGEAVKLLTQDSCWVHHFLEHYSSTRYAGLWLLGHGWLMDSIFLAEPHYSACLLVFSACFAYDCRLLALVIIAGWNCLILLPCTTVLARFHRVHYLSLLL